MTLLLPSALRRAHALRAAGVVLALGGAVSAPSLAQSNANTGSSLGGVYTCMDDRGNRLTSDRPIPECNAKEQRVLNRDGSLRKVVPPPPTADERAEREAAEAARLAAADAARAAADAAYEREALLDADGADDEDEGLAVAGDVEDTLPDDRPRSS